LYGLLDKAREAPVLWITGPPGCGKTTLISGYIESRRLPCLWYKVDEADADLATFFYYLGLAARKAAPRKKKRLPLLTPERLPGISVFAQRYFEDLSSILSAHGLLVLDDCHRVHEGSPFFGTIREGFSRLAPGMAAVLISRNDPHSSFSRERANRQMEVFGWEELRLTPDEATGIVKLQRKRKLPARLVSDLLRQTDGWAAGLVLLLESANLESMDFQAAGKHVPSELIDYFGSEIFHGLDEEQRNFLLRTAFLPRMTVSMAERLTGSEYAGRILSGMYRHNLFTEKHPQREPVYAYHALFREFLLEEARNTFSQADLARIRSAAAALLEETGYVEDAAGIFRHAEDWKSLGRLILSQARSLVMQGRNQTLLEWLGALPKGNIEQEPWLLYWSGVGILPFSPVESQGRFEAALQQFDERGEAAGAFLSWTGVVDSILMAMSNYTALDSWIAFLPRLLDRYGGLPPDEIGDRVTSNMFRALSFRQFPRKELELWRSRALAVIRESTDTRLKIELSTAILFSQQMLKTAEDADISLDSLREALRRPEATPLMRLWVDAVDATVSILLGRHDRVLRVANDGLAFAEDTGVHFVDRTLAGWGAMAAFQVRDYKNAKRFLGIMESVPGPRSPMALSLHKFLATCEAWYRQEPEKAIAHAKECLRHLEDSGNTSYLPTTHLLVAHAHHTLHEGEEAASHLASARRIGADIGSGLAAWLSALTEAYFRLDGKDMESVRSLLKEGLRIGRERGFFGTFLWRPGFFETIAAKALEDGIEVEYVRELIRRNRLVPDPAIPPLEQWPWPVKIYTLGKFELLVGDQPVVYGRKVQQKPLSLLKALIALGGREISEGHLSEVLWPETDGDMAYQSLNVALHRLRKLLGEEEALMLREGRLSLSKRHCWVDVWAFASFLGQAEKTRREGKGAEAARIFEKAVSLYGGAFLPFEEMSCATGPREKVRSGYVAAVTRLGQFYEQEMQWEDAVSLYGKGLEVDDLAEEFYRRLMVCHIRLGQESEALSVYRRCRRIMSSILGVAPSAETQAIASSLGYTPA
jgi:two-component SAPR family response regulator